MSGRFYDPNPVYFDLLSNQPVAGGFLTFYLQGTTTPKGTWSDSALTIPNTNPVPLDSSGRANVNIWLSGAYTVRLTDSLGAVIWVRDVDDGATGQAQFPAMESGKFLTNDGSVYLWGDVRQVPDPTGSANKILSTDGSALIWIAQAVATNPVVVTDTSVKYIGANSIILEQWGTFSIPASGAQVATGSFTFPVPYIAVPNVQATINRGSGVVAAGFIGDIGATASTTGMTVNWDLGVDDIKSQYNLTSPLPIMWRAIGKVAS
ncbi:hypothetical protein [Stenotrophomonas maltophilia]|uniref:Uncharacterized protein n=1 Tax=Stenotrophomonas maltophilia TaxID=40324 RepID=A0AAJ2MV28_STEMA|nr:hypothetical protein [Stenotrophomonas maltophilia]MDT3468916.1 hypothetical protein [Stenotrophomonas maltophilia]